MRSIDEPWEAGTVVYLDEPSKCTETYVAYVDGVKHYFHDQKSFSVVPKKIMKVFPNGKTILHFKDGYTYFEAKNSVFTGIMIYDNLTQTDIGWYDKGTKIDCDGLRGLSLNKIKSIFNVEYFVPAFNKVFNMTVSPNGGYFTPRGKYLKNALKKRLKTYEECQDLFHSIVP